MGAAGGALFALSPMLFIVLVGRTPDYLGAFLPTMLVGGIGVGLAIPSFTIAATRTLPAQRLATGIGAQTMLRQIGGALGIAAFVAILGTPTVGDVIGRYDSTRWFMLATSLLAGVVMLWIPVLAPQPQVATIPDGVAAAATAGID